VLKEIVMNVEIKNLFRAPYSVPNGLQVTDDGLWVADQISDRVALIDILDEVDDYGVTPVRKEIPSESSNTSGLAWGDGSLWLAANGAGSKWRTARDTDATSGEILRIDPETGATQARWDVPGGGGTHGIEFDRFDSGTLWLTTLKSQTVTQVRIDDWSIVKAFDLPYTRAHGVVRVEDGLWVVHTGDRVIVKLDLSSGEEIDRIEVPKPHPEPHGLALFGDAFLCCDATSGWIAKISEV
jgi:sugar lactone lactonase YvrE